MSQALAGLPSDLLMGILREGPTPLFATVSGAHLYGFHSPDSDVDLRGAFVAPLKEVLKISPYEETRVISQIRDGMELDWVAHDVHKFVRMMPQRNGYVLEQLYSPLMVTGGEWLTELRVLGKGCITRHLFYHYRGFAQTQRGLLEKPDPTVKALLYAYRVILSGLYVLQMGEIEANLPVLLNYRPVEGVEELIIRKRSGLEKGKLSEADIALHLPVLRLLEEEMEAAYQTSPLPGEVTCQPALDDYVVRARLSLG